METKVKDLLNKKLQERYSDGRTQVELRELIQNQADNDGLAEINICLAKSFQSTYGINYVCHVLDNDEVFFFSSTSLKKVISDLLKVEPCFFEDGGVLTVIMANRVIMGKNSAMVIEIK